MVWNKKKWRETKRNDEKQKEMTRNKKKWREAISHDVSPVAMFSVIRERPSKINVWLISHMLDLLFKYKHFFSVSKYFRHLLHWGGSKLSEAQTPCVQWSQTVSWKILWSDAIVIHKQIDFMLVYCIVIVCCLFAWLTGLSPLCSAVNALNTACFYWLFLWKQSWCGTMLGWKHIAIRSITMVLKFHISMSWAVGVLLNFLFLIFR